MKKVTIISDPSDDGLIIEYIGQLGLVQFAQVTSSEYEELRRVEKTIDYSNLYQQYHVQYLELIDAIPDELSPIKPKISKLQKLSTDPENEIQSLIKEIQNQKTRLDSYKRSIEANSPRTSGQDKSNSNQILKQYEEKYLNFKAKVGFHTTLESSERNVCYAVGVVKQDFLPKIKEYLNVYPDTHFKTLPVAPQQVLIYVFGKNRTNWIQSLFLVFEVNDISDTVIEESKLPVAESTTETIEEYNLELQHLEEQIKSIQDNLQKDQTPIEKTNQFRSYLEDSKQDLGELAYIDYYLRVLSDNRISILRTDVMSVLQGWVPNDKTLLLNEAVQDLEGEIGSDIFVKIDDPDNSDQNIPTAPKDIKPSILQPAWILTTLRGWPSAREINPQYISLIVFSFQFALMFGDVGQGIIILVMGLFLTQRYKRGIASKLGVIFIPMGIATIFFGFLYGSIFLIEGLVPPLLYHPLENIGCMMKLALGIAVVEMSIGLILGMINQVKLGTPFNTLGEHGLGALLFLIGLYFSGLHFLEYSDIFLTLSQWSFLLMMSGLILSASTPVLQAIIQKHLGMEPFGEAVGALLMTFVENLSNFFSYLRIAAFVLAHASLALAAHALAGSLGPGGLLLTNVIAMTFELISTAVQSLRLLYYEFMGKFYHGDGIPFKPFIITS